MFFFFFADPDQEPQVVPPNENMPNERVIVGGDFNRWLNITRTQIVQGAEDPDSRIYICEVCDNSTMPETCSAANYTQLTVGTPPNITDTSSELDYFTCKTDHAIVIASEFHP